MKAMIRVRKYKREWLAWWMFGEGVRLQADTPDAEPVFTNISTEAKYQKPHTLKRPATLRFTAFMAALLNHVRDCGEMRETEHRHGVGNLVLVQRAVNIQVDEAHVEVNENVAPAWNAEHHGAVGKWRPMRWSCLNGRRWVDMTARSSGVVKLGD